MNIRTFIKHGKIYNEFVKYLKRDKKFEKNKNEYENIENIFCYAESIINKNEQALIPLDKNQIPINEIINSIKFWIWKIYYQFPIFNKNRTDKKRCDIKLQCYMQFFNSIKNNTDKSSFSIISTNYDLVFETFAKRCGIVCAYHFPKNFAKKIQHSKKNVYSEFVDICFSSEKQIPIIKLHGSVNFFLGNHQTGKEQLFVSNSWNSQIDQKYPRPTILYFRSFEELKIFFSENGITDFSPAIIPPSMSKDRDLLKGYSFYKLANHIISKVDRVVFIGYSFPPSDDSLKKLFSENKITKTPKKFTEVVIIDPKPKSEEEYYSFLPKQIFFIKKIYNKKVEDLSPDELNKIFSH